MLRINIRREAGQNAAFQAGDPAEEVARILQTCMDKIDSGFTSGILHDLNGNAVGDWAYCPPVADEDEA